MKCVAYKPTEPRERIVRRCALYCSLTMIGVQLIIVCVIAASTITTVQTNTQPFALSQSKAHSTHQKNSPHSGNEVIEAENNVLTALDMMKGFWKGTKEAGETQTDIKSSESGSSSGESIDPSPSADNDTDQASYDHSHLFPTNGHGVFLPPIFDPTVLINYAESSISSECTEGWKELFNNTDIFGLSSGLKAVDAFGNIGAGFLQDNIHALGLSSGIVTIDAFGKLGADLQAVIYALGSYDECFSLTNTQYCLTNLLVVSDNTVFTPKIKYALCLPQQCSETDVAVSINSTNLRLHFLNLTISSLGGISCESEKKAPYNAGAIVMLIVWSLIALTVLGATIFHFVLKQIKNRSITMKTITFSNDVTGQTKELRLRKTVIKFILAFSLYKTIPSILSIKQYPHAITSLNGIRVISMFWVILGHTLLWSLHFSNNSLYVLKYEVPKFTFQANISAPFAVDSFFLLSGVLVAYLTLRKMAKLKGKFPVLLYYVHRILRITPAYAFVLFSYWFLTVHFADGPLWQQTVGVESQFYKNCERYWWTNMLYINNIYPWKVLDECMSWTWYLSNDMQFYIIAPIMVLPLYYLFPVGLAIIGGLLVVNIATLGALTGAYNLSGNMFIITNNTEGRTVADDIYTKPWARIGPYLVGLTLGFLLFKQMKPNFRKSINSIIYAFLWMLAIALCLSTAYGLHGSFNGESLSRADDISYQMFSRLAWSIGVAIVIFACHNGYGWIVNDFLSMQLWIPLSRLTFVAYLVHEIVLFMFIYTGRAPIYGTNTTYTIYAIAAVVLSYASAAVIASFVEFPMSKTEEVFFKIIGLGGKEDTKNVQQIEETELKVGVVHKNYCFQEAEKETELRNGSDSERQDEDREVGGEEEEKG